MLRNVYTKDIGLKKGLLQCINIDLKPNMSVQTQENEWIALNNNVLLFLENHSVSVFPYKIKIVN